METMVLLVFLAIVWAGVGVYWLRTRAPQLNLSLGAPSRRMGPLDALASRRPAPVVALRSVGTNNGSVTQLRGGNGPMRQGIDIARPGHSLTEPGVTVPGTRQTGVTSEQARMRRRNVLLGLVTAAVLSLIGVFVVGGTGMILLHLAIDALLLGFVLLLVQYQRAIELNRTQNLPVYAAPRQSLASTGTDGRY